MHIAYAHLSRSITDIDDKWSGFVWLDSDLAHVIHATDRGAT